MRRALPSAMILLASLAGASQAREPKQPKVAPGPNEPDLVVDKLYYSVGASGQ